MTGITKELWQTEAEKLGGPALADVLTEMRDTQRQIIDQLDILVKGFPNGDIEGHRRYHQAVIERIELRNKIVREALVKATGTGAVGGGLWLLYAIWQAFKHSVKQ